MVSVGSMASSSYTLLVFTFVEDNPGGETQHLASDTLLAQQHQIGFCCTGDKRELGALAEEYEQIGSQEDGSNLVGGVCSCVCQQ